MAYLLDQLSPESLVQFSSSLVGLPREEIRQAKAQYIRAAISDYRAMFRIPRSYDWAGHVIGDLLLHIAFLLMPCFWPIFGTIGIVQLIQRRQCKKLIRDAIRLWEHDLEGEQFDSLT
ncbi:MAG: hypothetical protein K8T25_00300 [Planctomycetia bacterium]|nr:hypothetical protein [Planctomycetia bacterium]